MRGVCACGVVLFHMHTSGWITQLALVERGGLFVDFFFVLSGFVIAASYGEALKGGFPLRAYLLLRLGRIYPLHFVMLLAFVGLDLVMLLFDLHGANGRVAFTGARSLGTLPANLLLVQIFDPETRMSWNLPSWSIAAEMWTYALTALGLAWLRKRFRLILALTIVFVPIVRIWFGDGPLFEIFWPLLRCLFGFSIGMLIFDLHAALRDRLTEPSRVAATFAELAALGAAAAAMTWIAPSLARLACPPIFGIVILILARERGAASDLLKRGWCRRLGILSYSIYMTHLMVLGLFIYAVTFVGRRLGLTLVGPGLWHGRPSLLIIGGGALPDVLAMLCLLLVVLAASITYPLVERPCRDASRRWARRIANRPVEEAERVAPTM